MTVEKPTAAQLAALMGEHAHRHPEKLKLTVTDGEKEIEIPVLLGNPSGACKMPGGKPGSSAWDDTVAHTFSMRAGTEAVTDQLVADCVLYPDAAKWREITKRWPALPIRVNVAIRQKIAASTDYITDPEPEEKKPELVATCMAEHGSAVWRKLTTLGASYDIVVNPPDSGVFRMFSSAMKKRTEKAGQLARDLAESCIVLIVREDGTLLTVDELLGRYPGFSILVGLTASGLGGISADISMGEW